MNINFFNRFVGLVLVGVLAGNSIAFADHSEPEKTDGHAVLISASAGLSSQVQELQKKVETLRNQLAEKQGMITHAEGSEHEECVISKDLQIGAKDEAVHCLQEKLKKEGYFPAYISPTGYFGDITREAVRSWQKALKVQETGAFDMATRGAYDMKQKVTDTHMHVEAVDASSASPLMTVKLEVYPDAMAGYNIHMVPTGFRFAPEHASQAHVMGEGHAHLNVDGVKVARVYGEWFHLGALSSGKHEISVILNTNMHAPYAVGGKEVSASYVVEVK